MERERRLDTEKSRKKAPKPERLKILQPFANQQLSAETYFKLRYELHRPYETAFLAFCLEELSLVYGYANLKLLNIQHFCFDEIHLFCETFILHSIIPLLHHFYALVTCTALLSGMKLRQIN